MNERMIGNPAPRFEMKAVLPSRDFGTVSLEENMRKGRWTVLIFYPLDFALSSPAELTAFSDRHVEFAELNASMIGVSTDTIHTHLAWVGLSRSNNGPGGLSFPLASDRKLSVSREYGMLIEEEGITLRGLFIISPDGRLRYQAAFREDIGRDVDETLRMLQGLQAGGRLAAN
ncbi:peroxiredoxin [Bhargavaea ginsengi]|uniref:peroxiredoxin n=1 Tax=Bhargavaea ginsengi TaxID=426757 RepID=UPI00203B515E|nr:peroxiredoxin [Bhargavaea ginsengi]MCM3086968.1 peroxiredoxin [Bhargavaea ginsengi]